MKKTKKIITFLTCLVLICSCTGCKSSNSGPAVVTNYYGEMEEGEVPNAVDNSEIKDLSTVQIKYSSFIGSKTVSNKVTDIYNQWVSKNELTDVQISVLDELLEGIHYYDEYIHFSHTISEEDFNKLMVYVYTNFPIAFNLDFSYSYDLGVNGYINNFYPKYNVDINTYELTYKSLTESGIKYANDNMKSSEYQAVLNAISRVGSINVSSPASKTTTGDYSGYLSQQISGKTLHSLGVAKKIKFYLDYVGVENIVVLGEFLDTTSSISSVFTQDELKIKGDSTKTVTMNLNNYIAWNLININGTWVNIDTYLDSYYTSLNGMDSGALICCPDEVIRQTRSFLPTCDLIGSTPPCSSYIYQNFYRNKYYIVDYSDEDIVNCIDLLIEKAYGGRINSFSFQFETEANFHTFVDKLPERIALYNEYHNDAITPNYKVTPNNNLLTVHITNLTYK